MNRKYNLKLDLQFRCNNSIMKFNQFDNNTSDFFMRITNGGNLVDIEKAIVVLAIIKPSGKVASQFVEVENGLVYADLKSNMRDEIGTYTAKAMLILEDERVVTDSISYEVEEDKIFSLLNDTVGTSEEFTLLTDMLSRLSAIEISEEQRVINEAERILSEENRKIEEAKRVEAELIRQHEEADRSKYDATRESNENIRKQNESIRLANEANRIDEEAKRVEEEAKRVEAEQLRKDNYNFMTEDEERRRSEANAHKEAEKLRAQAETNRVNEEAKRRTTEQTRISAENTRVSNESARKANETTRQTNETHRVEAETQRQNRYNSFIADAEINANNFENYTNSAKIKEEERKSNELNRKSQEDRRVSNEVERISNENTRKANEVAREKNETSRQYVFENKVNEVDKKIVELNTTKDNFVSNINTKVDTKISEIDNVKDNFVSSISTKVDNKISELDSAKSDMTNTVSNKVNEVENRFNTLTSKQQQDAEVIDARDGEISLKARLDRDIKETTKELDKIKKLEESTVSTVTTESGFTTVEATSNGYFEDVKLEGKTLVNICPKPAKSAGSDGCEDRVVISNIVTEISLQSNCYTGVNFTQDSSLIKPNTTYTIVANILENTMTQGVFAIIESNTVTAFNQVNLPLGYKGVYVTKVTTRDTYTLPRIQSMSSTQCKTGEKIKFSLMVLEGDHTQNQPSYFEGLKSVGQSATTSEDGVDEIVVSSTTNEFTKDFEYVDLNTKHSYRANQTVNNLIRASLTNISNKIIKVELFNRSDYSYHSGIDINPNQTIELDLKDVYIKWISFDKNYWVDKYETTKYYAHLILNGKADKKRLLYYNEETQTWEKPMLREWDSIEKHANGKYYYHQRSGAKVLNGSENWNNDKNSSTMSPATYRQSIQFNAIDIPSASFDTKTSPNIISDLLPTVVFGDVYSYNRIGISISGTDSIGTHIIINNNFINVTELKQWLQANNLTVVYQLAEEKVYECTNIDLITYNGETNFIVNSGAITPRTTLKVHNNISNVVSLLQKKVSLLESNITSYMITQNRLMLASRYNADTVSFKVDVATLRNSFEYDNDLYELILNNILVGKDNYNREYIENLIIFYWMDFVISDEMHSTLFEIIEEQHNPKVIEEETPLI